MRVRTVRTHSNRFGESYHKLGSAGPVYDAPDDVARNLIAMGYVEDADTPVSEPAEEEPKPRKKKAG